MAKHKNMPGKFQPGFLCRMDGRLEVSKNLHTAFIEVTDDMGGLESLSHVQATLAERFIFLEYALRNIEGRMAGDPDSATDLMGKWVQAINSLTGLARTIGLKRKRRKVESLQAYIEGSKNGKRKRRKV